MDDYIKKSDAVNQIEQRLEQAIQNGDNQTAAVLLGLQKSIQALPSKQIQPAVHAYWISYLDGEHIMPERYYRCSHCGAGGFRQKLKICPHCMAQMYDPNGGKLAP